MSGATQVRSGLVWAALAAVLAVPVLSLLVTVAGRELLPGGLLLALVVAPVSAGVVVVSGIAGARRGSAEHDGRR